MEMTRVPKKTPSEKTFKKLVKTVDYGLRDDFYKCSKTKKGKLNITAIKTNYHCINFRNVIGKWIDDLMES